MKILLVNPPFPSSVDFFEDTGRLQPLGLAYLAAYLKYHRKPVEIYDAEFYAPSIKEIVKKINKTGADIVGLSAYTPNFPEVVKIAKRIKKLPKSPLIILGGPHVTAVPSSIKKFPYFDFAILGEGEETLFELVQNLEKGQKSFEKIKGLAFLRQNKLILTPPRSYITNLDSLPFPARELLPPISAYHPSPGMYRNLPMATIITSRGCPYRCIFCCRATFGNLWRFRSPRNVVDEMEILIKDFGAKEIKISDDNFTLNEPRVIDICREIYRRKLKFSWSCTARADLVSRKMLKNFKKVGCWEVAYGIESGNQNVLNIIKKDLNLETVKRAVKLTRECGLEARGLFMIGIPGDTPKTIKQTIDFAKSLNLSVASFNITIPFPDTELLGKAEKYGHPNQKELKNYLNQTSKNPPFVPFGLSGTQVIKYHQKAYREFYLRPTYLISRILKIRSWTQAKAYLKAFLSIMPISLK